LVGMGQNGGVNRRVWQWAKGSKKKKKGEDYGIQKGKETKKGGDNLTKMNDVFG
jgi:hypothetical protein